MLPQRLAKSLWDAPFRTINPTANKVYIISRLLELGDEAAGCWLEET
jgi:hypothetical protein